MILRTILAVLVVVAAQWAEVTIRRRALQFRRPDRPLPAVTDPLRGMRELRPADYAPEARGLVLLRLLLRPVALLTVLLLLLA